MILDRLTLENFCLYRGQQVLELTPARKNGRLAPIVLVGGINGGGKTTLLNAIGLVLYGSRAVCCKRASKPYDEYLKDSIHRSVDPGEGASVALRFRYASEGREHVYEVRRAWRMRGIRVRENLCVSKDGQRDRWLSDHWNEVVEELIPLGISQLFFFDAEQIRFMAEETRANGKLGDAIKSLLGLDLAERLISDASVLEARLTERTKLTADRSDLRDLKEALEAKEAELRAKKTERAALENDRLRAEEILRESEAQFASVGGKHWVERQAQQGKLVELRKQEEELQSQLVNLAASELPLALVPGLLTNVQQQDALEQQAAECAIVQKLLEERDRQILRALKEEGVPDETIHLMQRLQDADRAKRLPQTGAPHRLRLSDSARSLLKHLQNRGLAQRLEESRRLLDRLETVRCELEAVQRSLEATPQDADVGEIADQMKSASRELAVLNDRAARLDAEINSLQFKRDALTKKLVKLRRKLIEHEIRSEEAARMAKLAIRTQSTMREFLRRATSAKIDRLSGLVTESFRYLLRKKTLVHRVHIDPDSFAITLYDGSGRIVPKEHLSEGEKQIFAISVLWGLAQGAPRPLPAIIDTPMARLDTQHRNRLVSRYFPKASHQVIILSTDTEIDQEYYRLLQPYIARAYHLNYDETEKVTVAEERYFWTAKGIRVDEGAVR